MTLIAITIVGTCVVLLVVAKIQVSFECDTFDRRCALDAASYVKGLMVSIT